MDNGEKEYNQTGKYKVAVASSDGIVVNQHFGRANTFSIYEVEQTGKCRLLEIRKVTPVCNGGNHDDGMLRKNIRIFEDCKYILVSRIGQGAATMMEQAGIIPMELPGIIEESIHKLETFEQLQSLYDEMGL